VNEVCRPPSGSRTALPPGWELRVARDYESGSHLAAEWLASAVREQPDLLLCAATGHSPTRTYELFVQTLTSTYTPTNQLRILQLDEWIGLPPDDPATCQAHLRKLLIQPLEIDAARFIAFESDTSPPESECERIEAWLQVHGAIDVCVLGLGINGHLGFNEPADELTAGCHLAPLTEESRSHPMLAGSGVCPAHGLTLGLRDILASLSILLLVFGATKAAQLERLLTGGISTHFPGSFLALHSRVICICDEAAAARLPDVLRRDAAPVSAA
jgi:putative deaminase/isomerase